MDVGIGWASGSKGDVLGFGAVFTDCGVGPVLEDPRPRGAEIFVGGEGLFEPAVEAEVRGGERERFESGSGVWARSEPRNWREKSSTRTIERDLAFDFRREKP